MVGETAAPKATFVRDAMGRGGDEEEEEARPDRLTSVLRVLEVDGGGRSVLLTSTGATLSSMSGLGPFMVTLYFFGGVGDRSPTDEEEEEEESVRC